MSRRVLVQRRAVEEVQVNVPVVVRLEGNNAELGTKVLAESGLNIIAANSLLASELPAPYNHFNKLYHAAIDIVTHYRTTA